jgi:hypothetical protein
MTPAMTRDRILDVVWTFCIALNGAVVFLHLASRHYEAAGLHAGFVLLLFALREAFRQTGRLLRLQIEKAEAERTVAQHALAQVERAIGSGQVRVDLGPQGPAVIGKGRMH